jgi:hypothetical protein
MIAYRKSRSAVDFPFAPMAMGPAWVTTFRMSAPVEFGRKLGWHEELQWNPDVHPPRMNAEVRHALFPRTSDSAPTASAKRAPPDVPTSSKKINDCFEAARRTSSLADAHRHRDRDIIVGLETVKC